MRRARTVAGTAATGSVAAVAAHPAGTATVLFFAVAAMLLFRYRATEAAVAVGWTRGSGRMRPPARATTGDAVPLVAAAAPVFVQGLDGIGAAAGPGTAAVPFPVRPGR
ncbi:hypothetical protein [Streptomyces sp. NPDC003036]|uniref:hypothetical protein n=1 Tax=Streptomyces sp. NPDC003036 TaxID=3154442 RepID=UPI0033B7991D